MKFLLRLVCLPFAFFIAFFIKDKDPSNKLSYFSALWLTVKNWFAE